MVKTVAEVNVRMAEEIAVGSMAIGAANTEAEATAQAGTPKAAESGEAMKQQEGLRLVWVSRWAVAICAMEPWEGSNMETLEAAKMAKVRIL